MRGCILTLTALVAASPVTAQTAEALLIAGDAAHDNLDPDGALRHYQAAIELESENYAILWRASRSAVDIGRVFEAEDDREDVRDSLYVLGVTYARTAVDVNPDGADGHFMLANSVGRVALTKGPRERVRYSKIVRNEARRALEIDSLHDGANHVLGRWHAEVMRLPGYARFIAKTFLGGQVFNEASWESAVVYLQLAAELRPDYIYHHLDLAEALIDSGDPDAAVPHLRQVEALPLGDVMDEAYKAQAAALLLELNAG